MVIGAGGETIAPATPDVPRVVQLVGSGVNTLLSAALLVGAVLALTASRRHLREHQAAPR